MREVELSSPLRVGLLWHRRVLSETLCTTRKRIKVGPVPGADFVAPLPFLPSRWSRTFTLLRPRSGGYELKLAKGFGGRITQGGKTQTVPDLLAQGSAKKGKGHVRVTIAPGDRGSVWLDAEGTLEICFEFTPAPEKIASRKQRDILLMRSVGSSGLVHGLLLVVLLAIWKPPERYPSIVIRPDRLAQFLAKPPKEDPPKKKKKGGPEAETAEKEKQEEGQTKRAAGEEGKVGRKDAKADITTLPKGDKDVLRAKVGNKGILGLFRGAEGGGSGLGKLLATNTHGEVEQAVAGLAGARVVAGRGAGGLGMRGTGSGGGGTGFGHIYGTGDIDTGGTGSRGRGRGGPALAKRGEREVRGEVKAEGGETEGSLSREQVLRVVRAHAAAIRYCYEKEIQRQPNLSGKIDVSFLIIPEGTVNRASISSSTMNNSAVEGCILRQIKQWQFPKSAGRTDVRFPFLFKGGV